MRVTSQMRSPSQGLTRPLLVVARDEGIKMRLLL